LNNQWVRVGWVAKIPIFQGALKRIEAEYAAWGEFLNGVIGLLAFSFGLSCLGTPRPDITGFMSLLFMGTLKNTIFVNGAH